MSVLSQKIRSLILPPRPDPAQSRRIAEGRLLICGLFALAIFASIGARIIVLADTNLSTSIAPSANAVSVERGRILDRNGKLLAGNLPITLLHADPTEIMNVDDAAKQLAALLPNQSVGNLKTLLSKETRYVELERQLSPKRHSQILKLGIPGVYFADSQTRVYPQALTAAHILGYVDTDKKGIAGIEKSMDALLAAGNDVSLSIDLGIQAVMEREIKSQIDRFEAIGGAGALIDIRSGELLAVASFPNFNPNSFSLANDDALFNRATKGVYEMGSTFKVLNTAIALETGASTIDQRYEVSKPLRISRFTITDYHPYTRPLNVPEILVYSSNIGSALMADAVGADTQRAYMQRLGLLNRLEMKLPETSQPLLPSHWRRATTATVSYGHGLSVSLVHLASAIATASGNGQFIQPTLIKRAVGETPMQIRVFSEDTARAVRSMMRLVVSHKDGTGNFAEARGYMVGGKTGTAEKITKGGYDKKANITTFVATFPVHDPRYVLAILIDEPKGQKHSFGYATAGWVVAPAVRRIVEQVAPNLGVLPVDEQSPSIRQKLMLEFKIGNKEATLASF